MFFIHCTSVCFMGLYRSRPYFDSNKITDINLFIGKILSFFFSQGNGASQPECHLKTRPRQEDVLNRELWETAPVRNHTYSGFEWFCKTSTAIPWYHADESQCCQPNKLPDHLGSIHFFLVLVFHHCDVLSLARWLQRYCWFGVTTSFWF